jgi:integrase
MLRRMEKHVATTAPGTHQRKGEFRKVGENLYRYSSNDRYYAVFRIKGKLIWKSLKTSDREFAKRKLQEELEKQGRVEPDATNLTLSELLKLYEESLSQFDQKTQATRRSILKKFKETWDHGFEISVRSVTPAQLELWLAKHRARLRKVSLNEYIRFTRQVFALGLKARAIANSPAADFKLLRPETPVRTTPTWKHFLAIVRDIRSQKFSADAQDSADLVEFMGKAGVGTAECAGMCGEHIDFQNKRITLYRHKTDTGYTIPIFPQLHGLLDSLRDRGSVLNGEPVFKVRDPKKALDAACKRLNLPHFSPRSLRRCFITRAIEKGVDFKTIASWQGHRDGGVLIAKTYSHLRNEHSDNMAKKLA